MHPLLVYRTNVSVREGVMISHLCRALFLDDVVDALLFEWYVNHGLLDLCMITALFVRI